MLPYQARVVQAGSTDNNIEINSIDLRIFRIKRSPLRVACMFVALDTRLRQKKCTKKGEARETA
jgi:hypothetical protein